MRPLSVYHAVAWCLAGGPPAEVTARCWDVLREYVPQILDLPEDEAQELLGKIAAQHMPAEQYHAPRSKT